MANSSDPKVTGFVSHLKSLSPAAADLEIRSLTTPTSFTSSNTLPHHESHGEDQTDERILFVTALTDRLRQKQDYELVQAWMTVFLRVHGGDIVSGAGGEPSENSSLTVRPATTEDGSISRNQSLLGALREWRKEQGREGKRLASLTGYCSGVIGFLRTARG